MRHPCAVLGAAASVAARSRARARATAAQILLFRHTLLPSPTHTFKEAPFVSTPSIPCGRPTL
jgi:hypothetical protein